jgi:hypothetical protein
MVLSELGFVSAVNRAPGPVVISGTEDKMNHFK